MREMLKKLNVFMKADRKAKKARARKSKGQSMVEIAIALPLLLMLFSGMVEFGFMLNTYLSLIDATRQTARFYSNVNPFMEDASGNAIDNMAYYTEASTMLIDTLDPPADPEARSIVLDPSRDDVMISVIAVSVSESTDTITTIARYPAGQPNAYYQLFDNELSNYADNAKIEALMTNDGAIPVRTGILIIEVVYGYEGVLKLPWVELFLDTITLRADTVMPLVSAKPLRTP